MLIRGRMTREVVTISPARTLLEALKLTRSHRIRHLPVVEGRRLVGIVSDRDLRLALPALGAAPEPERRRLLETTRVASVMVRDPITTTPDTPLEEAARLMYVHRIGCLPVEEQGTLVGIVTESDVLCGLVELYGGHERSSRLEVRMPRRPGELARVVRLIGIDHRLSIRGIAFPPVSGSDSLAIIHVDTNDPQGVAEALERLGYDVAPAAADSTPSLSVTP